MYDGKKEPLKKGKGLIKDKAFGAGSSTNESEGAENRSRPRNYNLYSVDWNRIILDEVCFNDEYC